MNRTVVLPRLSRPPVRFRGSVRDFSGWSFVISSNVRVVMNRRPGDVGLNCLSGIVSFPLGLLEELDHLLALLQNHVCLLPIGAAADISALALHLAVDPRDANVVDLHAEEGLDGLLDLRLR